MEYRNGYENTSYLGVSITDLIDKGMMLKDWDIWHSYTTYFIENITNLEYIAEKLIKNKLCTSVYHSSGYIWWDDNPKIGQSILPDYPTLGQIRKSILEIKNLDGYAQEGIYEAAWMRRSEIKLLSEKYLETFAYIRGYIGACYLIQGGRTVIVYPQIKIYNNGVVTISFRVISPKRDYPLDVFVKNDVNFPLLDVQNIEAPPELVKIYNRSIYSQADALFCNNIKGRYKTWKLTEDMDKIIDDSTITYNEGDFSFKDVSLTQNKINEEYPTKGLPILMDMVVRALSTLLNDKSIGIRYVLLGNKKDKIQTGNTWYGRPSVYILDFQGQPENSKATIENYGKELSKIINRVPISKDNDLTEQNLRYKIFDDYSIHMSIALTLWISSKKDYSRNYDINRGNNIYEKQILEESINYMRASHERQYERAADQSIPYRSLLKEQLTLVKMDNLMDSIGNSGEINNFHNYAIDIFNLPKIREQASECLKIRADYAREDKTDLLTKFGFILAALFGVVGAPSFSDSITLSVWRRLGWWIPSGLESQKIFLFIITIVPILLLLGLLWWLIIGKQRNVKIS